MAHIESVHESKTGDGDSRTTLNYSDGTSRDITITSDGIVVDDHDYRGNTVTGDGVPNCFNIIGGGVDRINSK